MNLLNINNTHAADDSLIEQHKLSCQRRIKQLLKATDTVLIAHYYTSPEIQSLAEQTGGCVADSLEMARFGQRHSAANLLIAGVRFMGETAKLLTPNKRVIMPSLEATCSLDVSCPVDEFTAFCDQHLDHTVVVYANTSAAVKARADWVVTSSIALEVVYHIDSLGQKIIWAPDRHLGAYIKRETGINILSWQGHCIVHDEFKAKALMVLKAQNPDAAILVHPESPAAVIELADVVGSTKQLIQAAGRLSQQKLIIATDIGIFYKIQQDNPNKELIIAPTGGVGATCRSCARCPWMAMNSLDGLERVLLVSDDIITKKHEIHIDANLREKAIKPLEKMLNFAAELEVSGKYST